MQFNSFLVFLSKDSYFSVKNFWPHRSDAIGFSIQNIVRKYRSKIPNVYSKEISNQLVNDNNLISMEEEVERISIYNLSINRTHWANRDFSEYKDAA